MAKNKRLEQAISGQDKQRPAQQAICHHSGDYSPRIFLLPVVSSEKKNIGITSAEEQLNQGEIASVTTLLERLLAILRWHSLVLCPFNNSLGGQT